MEVSRKLNNSLEFTQALNHLSRQEGALIMSGGSIFFFDKRRKGNTKFHNDRGPAVWNSESGRLDFYYEGNLIELPDDYELIIDGKFNAEIIAMYKLES